MKQFFYNHILPYITIALMAVGGVALFVYLYLQQHPKP